MLKEDLRLHDMGSVDRFTFPNTETQVVHVDDATLEKLSSLATNKKAWPFLADDEDLQKVWRIS